MTISVTHQFVSGLSDSADPTLVQPSNWNSSHKLSVPSGLTGRSGPIIGTDNGSGELTLDGVKSSAALQYLRSNINNATYEFVTSSSKVLSTDFAFSQSPSGTLVIGSNTATLSPIPQGLATGNYVYIAGTGTPEPCLITGWNSSNGQIIFTCVGTHSAGWSISSASNGIQEAIVYDVANLNIGVYIPFGSHTIHGTINIVSDATKIIGAGRINSRLYRTEDFGDTFVIGSAVIGSITDIQITDLYIYYDMGYTLNGSGQLTAITRKPTVFPNSAHIRGYGLINCGFKNVRISNMPYNLYIVGGAYSHITNCEFQGLWDQTTAGLQVCKASVTLTGDSSPHGSTQGFYITDCNFFGYNSPARTVVINGSNFTISENIGPQAMIECNYVEVLQYKGGLNGGGNGYGIYFHTPTFGISGVCITGVHFDGNRLANICFSNDNSGTGNTTNIEITGCDIQGSGNTNNGICIIQSSGIKPVANLSISNCVLTTFTGSAILFNDGVQLAVDNCSLRNYNFQGAWTSHAGASAINVGGNATQLNIGSNQYGGGTANDLFGVTFDVSFSGSSIVQGNNAGLHGSGFFDGAAYSPNLLIRNPDVANEVIKLGQEVSISGAVTLHALNDAQNSNVPLEVRASATYFNVGGISYLKSNFIASETGANNAIVGNITGISLGVGLIVKILLAHSLQAGANTFNYNSGGALGIKSSRNPANNIAVAYVAGGVVQLVYDGTRWMDLSQ